MIRVYYTNIENQDFSNAYTIFSQYISQNRIAKINKFNNNILKLQSLYSELLIRFSIISYTGYSNFHKKKKKSPSGKPYVKNIPNLYFNVSHSGFYVVIAIGTYNLGIDIEKIKKITPHFIRSQLSLNEQHALAEYPISDQLRLFFNYWCLKECYLKYLGTGINSRMDKLDFKISEMSPIQLNNYNNSPYFQILEINSDYKAAICMENDDQIILHEVFPNEILTLLKHK